MKASNSGTLFHKKNHWKWKAFLALFVIASIFGFFHFLNKPPNPKFSGVPLSKWLTSLDQSDPTDPEYQKASSAIYSIGTNAIPYLLSELQNDDSRIKGKTIIWINDHSFGKIRLKSAREREYAAVKGFRVLKDRGTNVLQHLVQMMEREHARDYAALAVAALQEVGIAPLTNRLTNSNPQIRAYAAEVLGTITNEAVVLPLLKALEDPDVWGVQPNAIRSLGRVQLKEALVVPKLIEALESSNVVVRSAAIRALFDFGMKVSNVNLTTNDVLPKLEKLSSPQKAQVLNLFTLPERK